jgi:hypothetical protein
LSQSRPSQLQPSFVDRGLAKFNNLVMAERRYPFSQIDAFTQERLKGNPCAVVLEAQDLTYLEMLAIAREMNLSETRYSNVRFPAV